MAEKQIDQVSSYQQRLGEQTAKAETWRRADRAAAKTATEKRDGISLKAGIGLSGGGIRSAIFCLGALQAMAAKKELKRIDYMSTVSGGGYIGGALQWWWNGPHGTTDERDAPVAFGIGPGDFPYGTKSPDPVEDNGVETGPQRWNLDRLRANGNYLTPGNGITVWSGVAILIRAILVNLLVWIPLLALLHWIFYLAGKGDAWSRMISPLPQFLAVPLWQNTAVCSEHLEKVGCGADACVISCVDTVYQLPATYGVLIWFAILMTTIYVAVSIAYAFNSYTGRETQTEASGKWSILKQIYPLAVGLYTLSADIAIYGFAYQSRVPYRAISIAAIVFGTSVVLLAVIDAVQKQIWKSPPGVDRRYRSRRFYETYFGWAFLPTVSAAAFGLIPVVFYLTWRATGTPGITGAVSVATGVGTALWGHYMKVRNLAPGLAGRIFVPIGSALFLYGLLVVSYALAMVFVDLTGASPYTFLENPTDFERYWICLAIAVSVAIALPAAFLVNINQLGPGRFYRDRIMEAFMPAGSRRGAKVAGESRLADNFTLDDLSPVARDGTARPRTGPYPIINTNVILFKDTNSKLRQRGGENFVLSPDLVGSDSTGGVSANHEITKSISLASAVATSGAAANPNSGYIGTGPTRDRLLSIAMMLLNLRLGYWLANPRLPGAWTNRTPNHVLPAGLYALGFGYQRRSRFIELSDGGHFDNLGIYELVRRELSLIFILDGEADPTTGYAAAGFRQSADSRGFRTHHPGLR